ncbi:DUF4954 family protein [Treponema sp. OttesenSCG-928-L16]|nr:DUF4954 family protein [Treponema sp. OttesenSCG-928-L16]
MKEVSLLSTDSYGYNFIPPEFLPPGRDEYWIRNEQLKAGKKAWRALRSAEIEVLVKNDNYCPAWNDFLVADPFEPELIRHSHFYGLIRVGSLQKKLLRHHDFCIPAGIRNSTIISCDIGDNCAIQDCSYISHYIIEDQVILSRIDEMQTTNHAKFGNGVLTDGESEDVRVWIDVMNEAGGRSILPFRDMIPADAYLWAAYRDDRKLSAALMEITQNQYGGRRGSYGLVGSASVIKSCRIIKDTAVGECAYIKGANKLKNLSVLSSEEEPSQIGEGVELVNGIIGYGSHIFYGAKAVRFVIGRNCNLKYGARLIHSVLGDNSTVSCCEILNNLIFPVHEQHHNNSFLIASLIQGMSNMAAGATIGSNHNSRANDGEIRAGRGFWPGLSVTLKHSSRFASFVLIAKGNYPYELNIPLPFSLVNNNVNKDRLEVMPAYFWLYNMYALKRNSWKVLSRDKRMCKIQAIENDFLAPDTAEEIIRALGLLESWMKKEGISPFNPKTECPANGAADQDMEDPEYFYASAPDEEIPAEGFERHRRGTVILKPRAAFSAYRQMLFYYAVKTIIEFLDARPDLDFPSLKQIILTETDKRAKGISEEGRISSWVNLGGQIVPAFRVDRLREEIGEKRLRDWNMIHRRYDEFLSLYPIDKLCHAWSVLGFLSRTGNPEGADILRKDELEPEAFPEKVREAMEIRRWMSAQVYRSRAKDFSDPFRVISYRNEEEMRTVAGKAENNPFILLDKQELADFEALAAGVLKRLESSSI